MPKFDREAFLAAARKADYNSMQEQLKYDGISSDEARKALREGLFALDLQTSESIEMAFKLLEQCLNSEGFLEHVIGTLNPEPRKEIDGYDPEANNYKHYLNALKALITKLLNDTLSIYKSIAGERLKERLFAWAINHGFLDIAKILIYNYKFRPQGKLLNKTIQLAQQYGSNELLSPPNSNPLFNFDAFANSIRAGDVIQFKSFLQDYDIDSRLGIPGTGEATRTYTPLICAAKNGRPSIPVIEELLKDPRIPGSAEECHQVIQTYKSYHENSPLRGYAKRLMQKFNQNNTDEKGETLLMLAAREGNIDAVEYYLENGADCDAKNRNGLTVLQILHRLSTYQVNDKIVQAITTAQSRQAQAKERQLKEQAEAKEKHLKEQAEARESLIFGLKVAGLVALGIICAIGLGIGIYLLLTATPIAILATAANLPFFAPVLTGISAVGLLIASVFGIKMTVSTGVPDTTPAVSSATTSAQPPALTNAGDNIAKAALAVHNKAPVGFQGPVVTGQPPAAAPKSSSDAARLGHK